MRNPAGPNSVIPSAALPRALGPIAELPVRAPVRRAVTCLLTAWDGRVSPNAGICIGATRVAVDHLREEGIRARPIACRLEIHNPAWTALTVARQVPELQQEAEAELERQ